MLNLQHPDTIPNQTAVKQITRGGHQAADDIAMEAYWMALSAGMDHEVAAEVFSKTYQQAICASKRTNVAS